MKVVGGEKEKGQAGSASKAREEPKCRNKKYTQQDRTSGSYTGETFSPKKVVTVVTGHRHASQAKGTF